MTSVEQKLDLVLQQLGRMELSLANLTAKKSRTTGGGSKSKPKKTAQDRANAPPATWIDAFKQGYVKGGDAFLAENGITVSLQDISLDGENKAHAWWTKYEEACKGAGPAEKLEATASAWVSIIRECVNSTAPTDKDSLEFYGKVSALQKKMKQVSSDARKAAKETAPKTETKTDTPVAPTTAKNLVIAPRETPVKPKTSKKKKKEEEEEEDEDEDQDNDDDFE